jgi:hypothetical protein
LRSFPLAHLTEKLPVLKKQLGSGYVGVNLSDWDGKLTRKIRQANARITFFEVTLDDKLSNEIVEEQVL